MDGVALGPGGEDGLKEVMDTWTTQKGLPAVKVTRTGEATATVEQRRFVLGPRDEADDHVYSWWIPLSYAPAGGDFTSEEVLMPKDWLEAGEDSKEITLEGVNDEEVPVIFNVQVLMTV